ncbi:universal stress protein [Paracoccus nototheniae]|uniref:Universal stress protein n=1 Tax=Paracoccus nototheniae TaxID=2489002 RepID=A0ABW4E3Y8_9RHOB|nr:universal stress protein [Paracoccus nototheniae]
MRVQNLALIVFDLTEAEWLLPQAAVVARNLDAHLTVLHAYRPIFFYEGIGPEPMIFSTIGNWKEDSSARVRAIFGKEIATNDIVAQYRDYSELYGAEEFVLSAGRAADIVLLGTNTAPFRSPDDRNLTERLVRNLGRPVLVLHPHAQCQAPFKRMMIGWSETREATRAAHDALALAADQAQIEIVSVVPYIEDKFPAIDQKADFAAALARRGLTATMNERHASAADRVTSLIEEAESFKADVIVAGAFGHSLLYDFVIGAVTRELLASCRYPLLLSH